MCGGRLGQPAAASFPSRGPRADRPRHPFPFQEPSCSPRTTLWSRHVSRTRGISKPAVSVPRTVCRAPWRNTSDASTTISPDRPRVATRVLPVREHADHRERCLIPRRPRSARCARVARPTRSGATAAPGSPGAPCEEVGEHSDARRDQHPGGPPQRTTGGQGVRRRHIEGGSTPAAAHSWPGTGGPVPRLRIPHRHRARWPQPTA